MKESKRNNILLTVIGIATLLIAVVGATFAYFTAVLSGQESATTVTINAGTLGITFTGGANINMQNIYPRGNVASLQTSDAWATKSFSVKANATAASTIPYALALVIDSNNFSTGALVFTLTVDPGSNTNGTKAAAISTPTAVPTTGSYSLGSGSIQGPTTGLGVGGLGGNDEVVHAYHLNIFFPDTGLPNQNDDQGKQLQAHVEITST